jgi:hypothetical protein
VVILRPPATCEQAVQYLHKLGTIPLPKEREPEELKATSTNPAQPTTAQSTTAQPIHSSRKKVPPKEVVGRMCPKCLKFLEKYPGLTYVYCTCGYSFCWNCIRKHNSYPSYYCKPRQALVFEYTLKLKFKHVVPDVNSPEPSVSSSKLIPKLSKAHQKVTMYQKAKIQRLKSQKSIPLKQIRKVVKKIAQTVQRDLPLKKEVSISLKFMPMF